MRCQNNETAPERFLGNGLNLPVTSGSKIEMEPFRHGIVIVEHRGSSAWPPRGNLTVTHSRPFLATLRGLYYAERKILKLLTIMATTTRDPRLKSCFLAHREDTRGQISRLRYIFADLEIPALARVREADRALISECETIVAGTNAPGPGHDAALISCSQALAYYEIARYRALIVWAGVDQRDDIVDLLEISVDEERSASRLLASIAGTIADRASIPAD
jgi:ferritin-like metal-binding protein YciE